jgi:hypothetical protein
MSATMVTQGGLVQLEQSDICLALNIAKMASGGISHSAIEEMQYLIRIPCAKVQKAMMRGVQFPGPEMVKDEIQRQSAMLCQNKTNGFLCWQNGTRKNVYTAWRPKGFGAPPPTKHRQPTPGLMPPAPRTPPAPYGDHKRAERSQIDTLPPRYV